MGVQRAKRLDTGSSAFNTLLGGGLPTSAVTDVFGAAATCKTQFGFQCALMTSQSDQTIGSKPLVLFVDCSGSFRPERIAEMAEARGIDGTLALNGISSIRVRNVAEQQQANERILNSGIFDSCKLVIVDGVTTNFVVQYPSVSRNEDVFIQRHYELSRYARKLAFIALARDLAVLLTNSVRSRKSAESEDSLVEGETTGDIISQFALFRLHFTRHDTVRRAFVVQPYVANDQIEFSIEKKGIVP